MTAFIPNVGSRLALSLSRSTEQRLSEWKPGRVVYDQKRNGH